MVVPSGNRRIIARMIVDMIVRILVRIIVVSIEGATPRGTVTPKLNFFKIPRPSNSLSKVCSHYWNTKIDSRQNTSIHHWNTVTLLQPEIEIAIAFSCFNSTRILLRDLDPSREQNKHKQRGAGNQ